MLNQGINLVVALDEEIDRSLVEASLPSEGVNVLGLVHLSDTVTGAEDVASDLLIVACTGESEQAREMVRRWTAEHPDRPVLAFCDSASELLVQGLFEAGADDVVKLPEKPGTVLFALEKALARNRGREASRRSELAPMICVLGPKGGSGKTVTTTNLAVGLASAGCRTAVVDLDLQFGDIGLVLGMQPKRTLYDLATSGGTLDAEKLGAYLVGHASGLRALLAPVRPDQAGEISTELVRSVLGVLRTMHDVVVVDTPPDFTPHVIAAVDASTQVCMVGMLDSLSLKNTKLGLETLELMGYGSDAISLVLNRANTNVGLTRDDVSAIVGRRPAVLVPSDRDVPRSVNEGTPVLSGRKRSPVAAAYRELAELYLEGLRPSSSPGDAQPVATNGDGRGQPKGRWRLRLVGRNGS